MEIGDRIRKVRQDAGLSQRDLAELLAVSAGLVGQWESHRKKPGRELVLKLAGKLGVPISAILIDAPDDATILEINDPAEVALIRYFRQMLPSQRKSHLALFRESVQLRHEIEQKGQPAKGKHVVG